MSEFKLGKVKEFYDQIGWQVIEGGHYQNARYEDLRPVSHQYIHRCHLRINQHLKTRGKYLLDAGSGPIQYPEYLTYSQGYRFRVCLDVSLVALIAARKRIGEHGLFMVADVAKLPFKSVAFDGIVSLHALHHLPIKQQKKAFQEFYRVLTNHSSAVVVNGWHYSALMHNLNWLIRLTEIIKKTRSVFRHQRAINKRKIKKLSLSSEKKKTGTFVDKVDAKTLRKELGNKLNIDILVWRSVSVKFLRAVIHPWLGGKFWLKILYRLENRFPHFFGEKGQYPLIVMVKESK